MTDDDDFFDSVSAAPLYGLTSNNSYYRYPAPPGVEIPKGWRGWRRMTNLAGAFADQRALQIWLTWKLMMGLRAGDGLIFDEWMAEAVECLTPEEQKALSERYAEMARRAAGADFGARSGTARHTMLEGYLKTGEINGTRSMKAQMGSLLAALDSAGLEPLPDWSERRVWHPAAGGTMGTLDCGVMCRSTGQIGILDLKGLALDTPIPTPDGWTTMGAVAVGERVFDAHGVQCTVIAKSEVKRIGTYVVRFDDGSEIVCDREHIWWTRRARQKHMQARSVEMIRETLRYGNGQAAHVVPNPGPLSLAEDPHLPVEPYLLGAWLGNGDRSGGVIYSMPDLFEEIESAGHALGKCSVDSRGSKAVRYTVQGLRTQLRAANLLGHKIIPVRYLRAGLMQRVALLQGLMDTDGTWNVARRTAVFTSVDKALAVQVVELLASLGQRPHLAEYWARGFGKEVTAYAVEFTPVDLMPFRLQRKAVQALASAKNTTRARRRVIVSVDPGPDVETACIAVDSDTNTYLCGDRMIPTHNTQGRFYSFLEIAAQQYGYDSAPWAWDGPADATGGWVPNEAWNMTGHPDGEFPGRRVALLAHMPQAPGPDQLPVRIIEVPLDYGAEVLKVAARNVELRSIGQSVALGRRVGAERPTGLRTGAIAG